MNEHIDASQWLPKGIAIISPERQRMLGITVEYDYQGIVKYARANRAGNVLQFLHREHILDDLEYDNGRDYEMWREMFRVFCGSQRMTASYDNGPKQSSHEGMGIREQGYYLILRQLPATYQRFIEYTIDTPAAPIVTKQVRLQQDKFQRVFNRLGAVMECVRKEIAECA